MGTFTLVDAIRRAHRRIFPSMREERYVDADEYRREDALLRRRVEALERRTARILALQQQAGIEGRREEG